MTIAASAPAICLQPGVLRRRFRRLHATSSAFQGLLWDPADPWNVRLPLCRSQAPKPQHLVVSRIPQLPHLGPEPIEVGSSEARWIVCGHPVDAVWTDSPPPSTLPRAVAGPLRVVASPPTGWERVFHSTTEGSEAPHRGPQRAAFRGLAPELRLTPIAEPPNAPGAAAGGSGPPRRPRRPPRRPVSAGHAWGWCYVEIGGSGGGTGRLGLTVDARTGAG
jgi:hypothetical protein